MVVLCYRRGACHKQRGGLHKGWKLLAMAEKETAGRRHPTRECTHGFKFEAPDGKMRQADVLDAEGVVTLAKHYPNNLFSSFAFSSPDGLLDISSLTAFSLFQRTANSEQPTADSNQLQVVQC